MKPLLIIEGAAHEIKSISYSDGELLNVLIVKDGNSFMYWEKSLGIDDDFSFTADDIRWVGRYEPMYKTVVDLIAEYDAELNRLSKNIAELYVEDGAIEHSSVKKYQEYRQLLSGVQKTKEMIEEIEKKIKKGVM